MCLKMQWLEGGGGRDKVGGYLWGGCGSLIWNEVFFLIGTEMLGG